MTLQWTVIAFVLYAEIAAILVLLMPWIRPTMWKKVFNSRIVQKFKQFSHVYFWSFVVVLILLFFDATREVRKYSHVDLNRETGRLADADAVIHMRLFRAQRNLYISGFSLLLALVIDRIVGLLSRSAHLEMAAEAAMKQAEGAGKAAMSLVDKGASTDGLSAEETKNLRNEMKELKEKLRKAEQDRDTMKSQSTNLQKEFDRLTEQLRKAETANKPADKKSD